MEVSSLSQDKDHWQILVSVIVDLRVKQNVGNFLTR
jgi:hypothetical protein